MQKNTVETELSKPLLQFFHIVSNTKQFAAFVLSA